MTNKKIVDALRCCHCAPGEDCEKCPIDNEIDCRNLETNAADLIERMDAEIRRLKERAAQKPLTLEEACESEEPCVYLEMRYDKISFRGYRAACCGVHAAYVNVYEHRENYVSYRALLLDIGTMFFGSDEYGINWRCWATKPTDEERKAAKWDD